MSETAKEVLPQPTTEKTDAKLPQSEVETVPAQLQPHESPNNQSTPEDIKPPSEFKKPVVGTPDIPQVKSANPQDISHIERHPPKKISFSDRLIHRFENIVAPMKNFFTNMLRSPR